ncbi:MAG: hypothetical protein VYA84_05355 [Planctomycetota bacterium]|nr:hypothetical protein [Planctomycetota bacterium]
MNPLFGIQIPVWISILAWFVGAVARILGGEKSARVFAWSWLHGSLAMWLHILGSYAIAYHWSHTEALLATAEESERVTGISAGWGVYVNFCFASAWTLYSARLALGGTWNRGIDWLIFAFTAGTVSMATIVFETGLARVASCLGFAILGLLILQRMLSRRKTLCR